MTDKIAVLLMAYGTPRTPEEILAYYTDIRRGRPPTDEQLADLTARYEALGGTSPLAARTEAQRDGLQHALDLQAPNQFYVHLGLKHAAPQIETAVGELAADGFTRAIGIVLAPHFSTMSIQVYQRRAGEAAAEHNIAIQPINNWHLLPAYVDFLADGVRTQLAALPENTKILFTAHSLPERVLQVGDPYPTQLRETAIAVANLVGLPDDRWQIAWQSAGRTPEPWLGPDILDVITTTAESYDGVLVCACGFISDHLEVLYDLDIEASQRAKEQHIAFARTPAMNDNPVVLSALAELIIATAASSPDGPAPSS
jgi:protoporphyrin/coproporphyrin ferrochelatase